MLKPETEAAYTAILQEELILATGCTEPIAIAYAAAKLRQVLGALPERITAEMSGNIIKNVKSVVVPNTGGLKGIEAAVAAGVVAGDADQELQVISSVPAERHPEIAAYLKHTPISVSCADTMHILDIALTGYAGDTTAFVRIADRHNNLVEIRKDEQVLLHKPLSDETDSVQTDRSVLNLHDILLYAQEVPLEKVSPLLDRQIQCNSAIAQEGLEHNWGANIGSTILREYGSDIKSEARAWAAAGSDARMSGCEMPVVILSGSGNQGITASLPVIRYAKHLNATQEALYRALLISDLVTVYQKVGIGRLSAYCGAISAGVGAGAGIAFLQGADETALAHTIVNAVAILSGTICDGAKPSCAAKIAASVDAGILGYLMYRSGHEFKRGEGIVGSSVANTVTNVGVLARQGMHGTDQTILKIMTE
ncbi:L-cysteine desulfidase family protein [Intestinimonas massiliensis (ex Afouda et al. 2020)]|uniref:L-cysteine desulfidase family protein n=1 Tax=Intestinimonas massiliensis (ex Afouda et al. 2020) TaxID=1673721 RepID=UPI001030B3CB|nr:L-serine ammonia-lyase, iron-sulfur-dependent, subunit alpha [Intestinimonas massiliensis (ex Afouda et al. 2020)]